MSMSNIICLVCSNDVSVHMFSSGGWSIFLYSVIYHSLNLGVINLVFQGIVRFWLCPVWGGWLCWVWSLVY